jgi:hypothetical protein
MKEGEQEQVYDVLQDVPYIQSEHFDSSQTFIEQQNDSMENFTD